MDKQIDISGTRIELIERGAGPPLLFLHPEIGIAPDSAVLNTLAERFHVLAPSHPGFGESGLASDTSTVEDLAYHYLDFMKRLDLRDVRLVGVGLGGWIAAEIAVMNSSHLSQLVLANSVGIKVGDRETRDIVDIFAITKEDLASRSYHDPNAARRDLSALSHEQRRIVARNWESTARFGWSPYMHNPKLRGRLQRLDVPTLILWGESDRIVSVEYGRALCNAIPGARFELIPSAGHYPHIEQPARFAQAILDFAGAGRHETQCR